jgi:transcriptional regulator with XRE-family HTH domain
MNTMTNFNGVSFVTDLNFKRRQEKYSLRDAAEEIGISASTLSRVCNHKTPDLMTYGKICKWLDEPTDKYFFEIPEDMDDLPALAKHEALDPDDVTMLREYGVQEYEIEGLNRYVQTIIDERDHFATGKPYEPEIIIPPYDDTPVLVELAPSRMGRSNTATEYCQCAVAEGDGINCSKCGKYLW